MVHSGMSSSYRSVDCLCTSTTLGQGATLDLRLNLGVAPIPDVDPGSLFHFPYHYNIFSSICLGVLGGTSTYSVPLPASTPSRDWGFQAPEIVGGQGRRGPHV